MDLLRILKGKKKIAINGVGRIGRLVLKKAIENKLNVVAVNDLADINNLAYLLKYDSVYGVYPKSVEVGRGFLRIDGKRIKVFNIKNPEELPWRDFKVDVVVESTGRFTEREKAELHLKAGANKVVISAPAKNPDITVVLGVNEKELKKEHKIISMASCTTNCLAPLAKVLHDNFGIKKGFLTTVHAYTTTQGILDSPNKKWRRGRAAALNIIPTTSGATTATAEVIPELKGKIDGIAFRVPVGCGSVVDFVAELETQVTKKEVNEALRKASLKELKNILLYTEEELVSSDIIGNSYSSIVDGLSTQVISETPEGKGSLVKVLSWYDNEYGYSCRIVDLLKILK